jgi:hypothetical protein
MTSPSAARKGSPPPKTADRSQSSPGAWSPMQDGEFVPKHSDFQLFDIIRAPTPERQRQDAAKEEITEGAQHGASDEVRCAAYSTCRPPRSTPESCRTAAHGSEFLHPSGAHSKSTSSNRTAVPVNTQRGYEWVQRLVRRFPSGATVRSGASNRPWAHRRSWINVAKDRIPAGAGSPERR